MTWKLSCTEGKGMKGNKLFRKVMWHLCIQNGSAILLIHKGLVMLFVKIATCLVNSHSPAVPSQNQPLLQPLLLDLCASHLPRPHLLWDPCPPPPPQGSSNWTGLALQGSSKNVLQFFSLHRISAAGTVDRVSCFVFPYNQRSRVSF